MSEISLIPATLLLVEDDPDQRIIMQRKLQQQGYKVICAENGEEAVDLYNNNTIDLVLMDAQLPGMDGFEACFLITHTETGSRCPVMMITSLENSESVDRAFQVGAEEYVPKPIHWKVLMQRIRRQIKSRRVHQEVVQARDALSQAYSEVTEVRERLSFERRLVEEIVSRMRQSAPINRHNLRTLFNPVEATSGDIILSAIRPDGAQHVMMGDATGHGLPAAIIGPLVSDIFYSMTNKGMAPAVILSELNSQLNAKLPTGIFLACCWISLNSSRDHLEYWNAGTPDILMVRQGKIFKRGQSCNIPLGVLRAGDFSPTLHTVSVQAGDQIYAYSDGIVECRDPQLEFFGQEATDALLLNTATHRETPLTAITDQLEAFHGSATFGDDVTLIEITC
ncbi:response regulator receiver protein [Magnetococcus marinus MC-1]|uniref:Response regulator receiver protein n=1 Tax=Magnetococcus marinus (strain ATCC BAA-1437 / JCM 17883 / MC-1) TaxID=156889 RepID=A0LDH6_MAGMM|nr:SpoIIE family protein phosphatase [Magnetococcus marinus]ABK46019.1 response regulator receiver protein [Magnetococcus marinus MC-1]